MNKSKIGISPHIKYPNSKTIRAVFSSPKTKPKKPAVCEHNNIDYKALKTLTYRAFTIIERLSKAIIILEERIKRYEEN
tara:strand:+ start:312 stop:548 length:237 start_codon:yes stop_codon:yes gene_type:complete